MTKLFVYYKYSLFKIVLVITFLGVGMSAKSHAPYKLYTSRTSIRNFNDITSYLGIHKEDLSIHRKKSFIRAAGETFGMNMSL